MKNKDFELKKLKDGIRHDAFKAKKDYAVRKLRRYQHDALDTDSSFQVEPYLYEVKCSFPRFFDPSNHSGLLKKVFYEYVKDKRHKYIQYLTLSKKQVKEFREAGLRVTEYKYKVYVF